MSTSGGKRLSGKLRLENPLEDRLLGDERNLFISIEEHEVTRMLHRLLGILFNIEELLIIEGEGRRVRLEIREEKTSHISRARIALFGERWTASLSRQELEYWCRFLTEVVLGVAAVDHIDLEDQGAAFPSITLKAAVNFTAADEADARKRLGS